MSYKKDRRGRIIVPIAGGYDEVLDFKDLLELVKKSVPYEEGTDNRDTDVTVSLEYIYPKFMVRVRKMGTRSNIAIDNVTVKFLKTDKFSAYTWASVIWDKLVEKYYPCHVALANLGGKDQLIRDFFTYLAEDILGEEDSAIANRIFEIIGLDKHIIEFFNIDWNEFTIEQKRWLRCMCDE